MDFKLFEIPILIISTILVLIIHIIILTNFKYIKETNTVRFKNLKDIIYPPILPLTNTPKKVLFIDSEILDDIPILEI